MAQYRYWIVDILCDAEIAAKIQDSDHGFISYEMVCDAVRLGRYERATWRVRGTDQRLFVVGTTATGVRLLAILRPVDMFDGKWQLASAWRLKR